MVYSSKNKLSRPDQTKQAICGSSWQRRSIPARGRRPKSVRQLGEKIDWSLQWQPDPVPSSTRQWRMALRHGRRNLLCARTYRDLSGEEATQAAETISRDLSSCGALCTHVHKSGPRRRSHAHVQRSVWKRSRGVELRHLHLNRAAPSTPAQSSSHF